MQNRFDLNNDLNNINILQSCNLQTQLYSKPIWGRYNHFGIKISKLKLIMLELFPIINENISLAFINIKSYNINSNADRFELKLKHICYSCYSRCNDIIYASNINSIDLPLMELPRLTKQGVINIEDIQRILISQFMRPPGIRVERINNFVNISLQTLKARPLCIKANALAIEIGIENNFSDYASFMLSIETKAVHIFKKLMNTFKIAYYKNKWYKLIYKTYRLPPILAANYGFKRKTRQIKLLLNVHIENNITIVNNIDNIRLININSSMAYTCPIALHFANVLDVAVTTPRIISYLSRYSRYLSRLHNNRDSKLTIETIQSIDLTLTGRHVINSLLNHKPHYGLDLITKHDLITIWNKMIESEIHLNYDNTRILRGFGDLIIGIVKDIISNILAPAKFQLAIKEHLSDITAILLKQVQIEINKLLNTSNLCQYADQFNSLAELSHRNKLTYMNGGNMHVQATDGYIRDVQEWYFGRICPIESPEGQNIGLINTLTSYSNVDVYGFILIGQCKVYNGLISNDIVYLNPYEERRYHTQPLKHNLLYQNSIKTTNRGNTILYIPKHAQIFSYAVSLIPFLSHNDPTRALMAANMQKQAIPLAMPQAPLIGTGEEHAVMRNTYNNIIAKANSVIISVDCIKIIVYEVIQNKYRTYALPGFKMSQQETCLKLRPTVYPLQVVKRGEVLAECQSSDNGEMSLGANFIVAFTCLDGFNYEDSILISESVVENGTFDSLHVINLESKVISNRFGNDLLTNNISAIPFNHRKWLLNNGIIKVGSIVFKNDVLIGKLSPIGIIIDTSKLDKNSDKPNYDNENHSNIERNNKPYNNILDTSLRVPEWIELASVLEVHRTSFNSETDGSYERYISNVNIANKSYIRRCYLIWYKGIISRNEYTFKFAPIGLINEAIKTKLYLIHKYYITHLKSLALSLLKGYIKRLPNINNNSINSDNGGLNEQVLETIKVKLLIKRSIQAGDKISGRHGNKGVISKIVPKQDMPFMADGTIVDIVLNPLGVPSRMNLGQILEANFGLISYKLGMEFKQILEMYEHNKNEKLFTKIAISKLSELYPNVKNYSFNILIKLLQELSNGVKITCPLFNLPINELIKKFSKRLCFKNMAGQFQLYNGKTGLPFDRESTVGIMYMFKLNHLVDDKMHARSTGPYSVITQQPLKGKANKGGQRLGEMEIWALQSYGAAYTVKEVITAKCDDILSRVIMHESLLFSKPLLITSWGEGVLLLLKELFSMCMKITFT